MAQREQQEDVEIVVHYADEDTLDCVQALLLLAGYDEKSVPPTPTVIKQPRRGRRRRPDAAA